LWWFFWGGRGGAPFPPPPQPPPPPSFWGGGKPPPPPLFIPPRHYRRAGKRSAPAAPGRSTARIRPLKKGAAAPFSFTLNTRKLILYRPAARIPAQS
ncbi:hypothetical protein C5939_10345, partial [Cronobacter sakazakii]